MSKLHFVIRVSALCVALLGAGCDDEDDGLGRVPTGTIDASASILDSSVAPLGDAGTVGDGATTTPAAPAADPLYLIGSSIQTTDESTLYVWASKQLEGAKFDFKQATELPGAYEAVPYNGYVFVPNGEKFTITRYELKNDVLVPGPVVSFAGQGLKYLSYVGTILSPTRAFIVNDQQFKIIEWNPTTMTITKLYDIAQLRRMGWGNEYRNGFLRSSDGKFFLQWTYTNDRKDFINSFVLAAWDTNSGELTIEENTTCPTSAGFGGFFDEQGDLYMMADSFGLFTQFGGFKEPKPACILRVKKGETKLDSSYSLRPSDALGGHFPWGFYYLGNGLAFTSGVDPAITSKFNSVFEIIFAPEHEGWLLDLKNGSARKIANLPKDGVGFESHSLDGRLFVPRTTGKVTVENIMSTESTLFEIKPDATAVQIFKLPGNINPVARIR